MVRSLSIVVPLYNEEDNVCLLVDQIRATLDHLDCQSEIVFVDDGSRDATVDRLLAHAHDDSRISVVRFRRNYGQTAAMQAGLEAASGDVIITMDGDLQNDPTDIPMMLAKIDEGYDLVHGWRRHRQDAFVNRKLPSKIANWLISKVTGFPIHDLGCTLKAIRREIADELELYGEMHRFIPILAHWRGARCIEVETRHHPRRFGKTKYGISRTVRVVLDLLTVKYMLDYYTSPMKFFGRIGLAFEAIGALLMTAVLLMKTIGGVDMTGNPLLLLSGLFMLMGVQVLSVGLLGEANTRLYYSREGRRPFTIREHVRFGTVTPQIRKAA
jgi:glycosyltransferase involved in cell wall biosynthesis